MDSLLAIPGASVNHSSGGDFLCLNVIILGMAFIVSFLLPIRLKKLAYGHAFKDSSNMVVNRLYRMVLDGADILIGDFENNDSINALSCNQGALIYAAGTGLSSYHTFTDEWQFYW